MIGDTLGWLEGGDVRGLTADRRHLARQCGTFPTLELIVAETPVHVRRSHDQETGLIRPAA